MKKKWIAACCAAAVLCAATVPALAESNTNTAATAPQLQMGGPMGQMGRGGPGGQMGQMPGRNGQMPQMGEMPQMGQMPSGEMPQMGEMPTGEMPQMDGQMPGGMGGQMGGMMGGMGQYTSADSPSEVAEGETTNSAADLAVNRAAATKITVSDANSDIKITEPGTYLITGKAADGNITVKKGVTGVVLILENLDLTSTTGATLSINKESQVKVVISGTVTLTDNENPDDETSTDAAVADAFDGAAIKVKAGADCVITGNGTLTVNGNAKNGINLISGSAVINSAYNGGEAGIDFVGSYYLSDDFDLTNNGGVAFDAGMGGMGGQMGGQFGGRGQMGQNGDLGQNGPVDTQPQVETSQPNFFQRIANWFSNLFSKK